MYKMHKEATVRWRRGGHQPKIMTLHSFQHIFSNIPCLPVVPRAVVQPTASLRIRWGPRCRC